MKHNAHVFIPVACMCMLLSCRDVQHSDTANSDDRGATEVLSTDWQKTFSTDFENTDTGTIAPAWSQALLGEGTTKWEVTDDNGNKVFAQLQGGNPNKHFNIAVYEDVETTDVELSVRLRAVRGFHDQGGGFVWRYKDPENHYIVRANPLENNVVLYKMEDGERSDLPLVDMGRTYGIETDTMGFRWHELKLAVVGNLFAVFFDGKQLFRVEDNTFTGPGKVGLWTKADAVTYFDDFTVKY